MKKQLALLLILVPIIIVSGCASNQKNDQLKQQDVLSTQQWQAINTGWKNTNCFKSKYSQDTTWPCVNLDLSGFKSKYSK